MTAFGGYTRGEVAFLLSIDDHDAALAYATRIVSPLSKLTDELSHHAPSVEDSEVPFIAKWVEVHGAKARIERNKEHLALTQLRLQGHTEQEVAQILGLGRRTVGRRMRATLNEILDVLGSAFEPEVKLDHVDACLRCAVNPRGRTTRRTRVWTGARWKTKTTERPSSLCNPCLEEAAARLDENGNPPREPNTGRGGLPWPPKPQEEP